MTIDEIETRIANYLNREGDPIVTDVAPFWVKIAHSTIQRMRNWKCQETTGYESFTDPNQIKFCAPPDIKEGFSLYALDPSDGQILHFYHQGDIQTLRDARAGFTRIWPFLVNTPSWIVRQPDITRLFAIWGEDLHIYPKPGDEMIGKILQWDYYRWLDLPGQGCEDWFT